MGLTEHLRNRQTAEMTVMTWARMTVVIAAILSLCHVTPAMTLTQVYTDGNIQVSWHLVQTGNQSENSTDGSTFDSKLLYELAEFCEFGAADLVKLLPSVDISTVDRKTVLEGIQACEEFLLGRNSLNRDSHQRQRRAAKKFQAILTGTKWCGKGNVASSYDDLGRNAKTDACCRDHDHCPERIKTGQSRSGVHNLRPYSMFPCWCDEKFRTCLNKAGTMTSNTVGFLYFNVMGNMCYMPQEGLAGEVLVEKPTRAYIPCIKSGFFKQIFGSNC